MALSDNDFQSLLTQLGYMPSKKEPIASFQPEQMATSEDNSQIATANPSEPALDDTGASPMALAEMKAGNPSGGSNSMQGSPSTTMAQYDEKSNPSEPVSNTDAETDRLLSAAEANLQPATTLPAYASANANAPTYAETPEETDQRMGAGIDKARSDFKYNQAVAGMKDALAPGQTPPAAMPNADTNGNLPGAPSPYNPKDAFPVSQSTNPLEQAGVNDQAIQDAQQQARNKGLVASIGEGLGTFASEAGGKKFDPSFYQGLQNRSQQPVKDVETRRNEMIKNQALATTLIDSQIKKLGLQGAQQANDPNSEISKSSRGIFAMVHPGIEKTAGYNQLTANQLKEFAQQPIEAGAKIEASKAQRDYANQLKQNSVEQKQSNKTNDDFMKFGKQVQGSIASSRGDFGKNSNVIRQAGQLDQLIAQIKSQPGGADKRQYFELARQLDGMLSSGQGTITGTKELMPETARKQYGSMVEWLNSSPQPAGLDDFVKRAEDTIKREKNYAVDRNAQTIAKMAPGFSHLKKADPERWNEVLNQQGLQTNDQGDIIGMQAPQELTRTPAVSSTPVTGTTPAANTQSPQSSDRVEIITSKGDHISLPKANLDAARKRDPNLQVVQ